MCHEEREEVFALLAELGARPIDIASELTTLVPASRPDPAGRSANLSRSAAGEQRVEVAGDRARALGDVRQDDDPLPVAG